MCCLSSTKIVHHPTTDGQFDTNTVLKLLSYVNNFHLLRCQLFHYSLVMSSFQKQRYTCEMLPLETEQSGGKLLPHSDLQRGVFLGETSSSRSHFYKKDYKGKKNEQHSYKTGKWNVRTLNR